MALTIQHDKLDVEVEVIDNDPVQLFDRVSEAMAKEYPTIGLPKHEDLQSVTFSGGPLVHIRAIAVAIELLIDEYPHIKFVIATESPTVDDSLLYMLAKFITMEFKYKTKGS